MKTAIPALVDLLNSGTQLVYADLYTFTYSGGLVQRYTSADKAIPYDGQLFNVGPLIKRNRLTSQVGVAVDTLEITMHDAAIAAFASRGGLDGATVLLQRAFMLNWTTDPVGALIKFGGRVSDVDASRTEARIVVNSFTELLDVMVPANVYQPQCKNTLYGTGCGLSRAANTVSNAVTASPTPTRSKFDTTLAQATGFFDLGVVTFTSGENTGIRRTVKKFLSGGLVETIAPFPFAPASGDTFTIYPGCNRTQTTCSVKFNNLIRFRGAPYIPVPETVQ